MDENFKPGDFIVGRYNDQGGVIKPGKASGDAEDIAELQKMMMDHGARTGGRVLPKNTIIAKTNTRKGKKKKIEPKEEIEFKEDESPFWEDAPTEYQPPVDNKPVRKKYIYLYNKLGKIRLSIEDLLENEQAYCVVFRSEDDLIFVPNAGETLTMITPDGSEVSVYYANALFTWSDHNKQLMVLFKNNE